MQASNGVFPTQAMMLNGLKQLLDELQSSMVDFSR